MAIFIVTDLSYGDSGKGTTVDYLARQGSAVVVRHNGGPQAAHNVVLPDGSHHTFSQFGAGSLAGAKTYLSRFMLINPFGMMNEANHLISFLGQHDIWDRTFVDADARLVTSWHAAVNRLREIALGAMRHGSCGQGIGVCMEQDIARPDLTLRVRDIHTPPHLFAARLEELRKYLHSVAAEIPGTRSGEESDQEWNCWSMLEDDTLAEMHTRRFREWADKVHICHGSDPLRLLVERHDTTIFEGAQGVLLDEWYGWNPYTTWSTCTHDNALTILDEDINMLPGDADVIRLGVIRTVTTRHGAGPHPTEDWYLTNSWREQHNTHGKWQGAWRVGHLDLCAHRYAMNVCRGVDKIVVTHLDARDKWLYCDRYVGMPDIPIRRDHDLAEQARITNQLRNVKPVLTPADDTDALLEAIELNLAPIMLTSSGPAHVDKCMLYDDAMSTGNIVW